MNTEESKYKELLRKYPKHLHEIIYKIEIEQYSWKKELQDCWVDISLGNSRHLSESAHGHFIYMRDFLLYLTEEKLQ